MRQAHTTLRRTLLKNTLHRFLPVPASRGVLIVAGCQRSGTNLLTFVFDNLLNTRVFPEFSVLSKGTRQNIRLRSLEEVHQIIAKQRAALTVIKPLVESHRIHELLHCIPNAKVVWLYRDYRDVAQSNMDTFRDGIGMKNITAIIKEKAGDWRAEGATAETRALLEKLMKTDITETDANALFWLARNRLFFEQKLDKQPKVRLLRYEDFVAHSKLILDAILDSFGLPASPEKATRIVSPNSVGRARKLPLSPHVESACQDLLRQLDATPTRVMQQEETSTS